MKENYHYHREQMISPLDENLIMQFLKVIGSGLLVHPPRLAQLDVKSSHKSYEKAIPSLA